MAFVTGMNRDRDGYQVAVALAEADALAALVTDYYYGVSRPRLRRLEHRSASLDRSLVHVSQAAFLLQFINSLRERLGAPSPRPYDRVDRVIGDTIRRVAKVTDAADLLVYSGYAAESFEALPDRHRMLFQFHPSASAIRVALSEDELGGAGDWEPEPEVTQPRVVARYEREIEAADGFICASSFTARGLVMDGVRQAEIAVVPYGCPRPTTFPQVQESATRTVLFVGQGVQRKGLHTLLEAWRRVRLPGWRLRIVASRMDPAISRMLGRSGLENVTASGPVSRDELDRLYREADTLALPSLVEGFGLVLGEALSRGCRLLATDNTGLPDMRLPNHLGLTVRAGSVDSVVRGLTEVADTFDASGVTREESRCEAARLSWSSFRQGIRRSVGVVARVDAVGD